MQIYRKHSVIADYETDSRLELTIAHLLSRLQELAMEHLVALGCTHQDLFDHSSVFLLSKVALRFCRMPRSGEEVELSTWAPGTKGAAFLRQSQVHSLGGELLAECDTQWMLVDPASRKILRPKSFFLPIPAPEGTGLGVQVEKLSPPQTMEYRGEREIRYSDLDCNKHVNNANYVWMLYDFGTDDPFSLRIRELQLHFVRETLLGDTLSFYRHLEGNTMYFRVMRGGEVCLEARAILEE